MSMFRPVRADRDPGGEETLVQTGPPRLPEPAVVVGAELSGLIEALPVGHALLVVHHGPQAGARYLLDQDVTVAGRDPRAGIMLDDATVSRKHSAFVRTGAGFTVRDLNSLNGTYVGGSRVPEMPLAAGDVVRIGKFRLVYHPSPTQDRTSGGRSLAPAVAQA